MVDTWVTVGSVRPDRQTRPPERRRRDRRRAGTEQAAPVIIEDNCFVGSRRIVVEGAHICREAVLGANVVITGSTKIIDVTGREPKIYKGYVPPRSVVIPGSYTKQFPAGTYQVPCALIIGQRKASTDLKTTLNDALREFNVSV